MSNTPLEENRLPDTTEIWMTSKNEITPLKEIDRLPTKDIEMTNETTAYTSVKQDSSSKASAKLSKKSNKSQPAMLTSGQLSDLFRRLDTSGDGELDYEEFQNITTKLKFTNLTEGFVAEIFNQYDTQKSGTLSLQEFQAAYTKVFAHANMIESEKYIGPKSINDFILATRYGIDNNDNTIYEIYSGIYPDITEVLKIPVFFPNLSFESNMDTATVEPFTGTVETLNHMVREDGVANSAKKNKIFWWIDVSIDDLRPTSIERYIQSFGLPNTSQYRSNFGSFHTVLSKEKGHRIYAGNGRTEFKTSSLTFFVQTLAFHKIPILYSIPRFVENLLPSWTKSYWSSKLAFFFPTFHSNHKEADKIERFAKYRSAESIATRLVGDDEDILDDYTRFDPYDSRCASGIPIPHFQGRRTQPDWLTSATDLKENPPSIEVNTASLSILDHGYGPVGVVTIREIDDEKNRKHKSRNWTLEELSRCGVLGRVFAGIRKKIFLVMADRKCLSGGELLDAPFALVMMIMGLSHSFSMNALGTLDSWLAKLEDEIDDIAVSKHQNHVKAAKKLCRELQDYVQPYYEILETFRNDIEPNSANTSHLLNDDIDNSSLKFDNIKGFFGISPVNYLDSLVYGNNVLEMKGMRYWSSQLEKYSDQLNVMGENVLSSLDEKRNFYSFLLTVVTIFLAPLTILTGYFGMNFNNMIELDEVTYPGTPGVVLLWVIAGVSYGVFVLAAIHYRIIYSAT